MDNRNNHNLILAGFYLLAVVLFGTFGFIEGNATEDEILIKANIKTAGGELIMNPTLSSSQIPNFLCWQRKIN